MAMRHGVTRRETVMDTVVKIRVRAFIAMSWFPPGWLGSNTDRPCLR